jgi:hypothetical protein
MMTTMTTEKRKTKTNLFDNFYAILLPHKTKKLSDTYFISWRQKNLPWRQSCHRRLEAFPRTLHPRLKEREGGREGGRRGRRRRTLAYFFLPFPAQKLNFKDIKFFSGSRASSSKRPQQVVCASRETDSDRTSAEDLEKSLSPRKAKQATTELLRLRPCPSSATANLG